MNDDVIADIISEQLESFYLERLITLLNWLGKQKSIAIKKASSWKGGWMSGGKSHFQDG